MIKILPEKDFSKLEKALPYLRPKQQAVLAILMYCGLRVGELTRLRLSDIKLENGKPREILVRASTTKTRVGRYVPIPYMATKPMLTYLATNPAKAQELTPESYLFPGKRGRAFLGSRAIQTAVATVCRITFKKHVNPHLLRHTYATMLLKHTDIRQVQMLLGHKKLSSTEIYTHPTFDDLTSAVDRTFARKKSPLQPRSSRKREDD